MARDNLDRHLVSVTKDELKKRATEFIKNWEGHHGERSEAQVFWHEFFAMFNLRSVEIGMYELAAKRATTGGDGRIDYLIPWDLAVEHKSSGEDLFKAMDQLIDYLPSLKQDRPPRLLVTCDFGQFMWHDLETGKEGMFPLTDLVANLDLFWWLAGHEGRGAEVFEDEEAANLKATDLMAKLYDAVMATNYDEHALREWLTRILFCMFADDTDVWPRNAFVNFIHFHTQTDGTDLGSQIQLIFQILNTAPGDRPPNLDSELSDFTYINGDLFKNTLPMVFGDSEVRTYLLEACRFDWSIISPAIFGSMFQNVMTPAERRHLGAHYTTLENIMKTIRPLFLDDLEAELKTTYTVKALEQFHQKLASLTFFDPACGCGNFLVVAYGELRRLEKECLQKIRAKQGKSDWQTMGINLLFKVTVGQFYGIEIEEFPARIARTALYLMDHTWNRDVSKEFGQYFVRFPIPASPHIVIGNALRMDWNEVLPASEANYVMGNPPFVGMSWLDEDQQADNRRVFEELDDAGRRTGRLDYVACWYAKSINFGRSDPTRFAYVSTNSITQGDQARILGPLLENHGYRIDFAHRTFAWMSEARGKAHVHVVIIGFSHRAASGGKLFDYPDINAEPVETNARNINWYLADAPNIYPSKHTKPFVDGLPRATQGSKPWDGTNLLVGPDEYESVYSDPIARKYLYPFRMGQEFVQNRERWCLWLVDAPPADLRSSSVIRTRLEAVAEVRRETKTASVQAQASTPYLFSQIRQPATRYLAMPKVSSSRRKFVPGAYLESNVIAGDKLIVFPDADLWLFGVLHSSMWNAWVRTVGGRLKSDIDLSVDLVYNAFPFPDLDDASKAKIALAAQSVLDARANYPETSLADLYDPLSMPAGLAKAHDALDKVVDSLFTPGKRLTTDADRLAILFERYEALSKAQSAS